MKFYLLRQLIIQNALSFFLIMHFAFYILHIYFYGLGFATGI